MTSWFDFSFIFSLSFFWRSRFLLGPSYRMGRVYKWNWTMCVCCACMSVIPSKMIIISARTLPRPLWPYIFWKLMMKAIQKSSEDTNTKTKTMTKTKTQTKCLKKNQHMPYFWNPDDLLIQNMMIDTYPWSSFSCQSPWLPCSGHTIRSTGPSA